MHEEGWRLKLLTQPPTDVLIARFPGASGTISPSERDLTIT